MNIYFVNYSDENYKIKQNYLNSKASIFDGIFSYDREYLIATEFYKENKKILEEKRGSGYWIWKPYLLLDSMNKIKNGDVLFYLDCGDDFNTSLYDFLKNYHIENDIILTNGGYTNKCWTKRDAFILMDCDSPEYWDVIQLEAGILSLKKTNQNIKILEEWLLYCKNENILTDIDNKHGDNFECFRDHRHDQSILTNIKVKYNLTSNDVLRNYVVCNV